MNDPQCFICTPKLCIHGEQSPTVEELEQASLEEQLVAMTRERDVLKAKLGRLLGDVRHAWGVARGEIAGKTRSPRRRAVP